MKEIETVLEYLKNKLMKKIPSFSYYMRSYQPIPISVVSTELPTLVITVEYRINSQISFKYNLFIYVKNDEIIFNAHATPFGHTANYSLSDPKCFDKIIAECYEIYKSLRIMKKTKVNTIHEILVWQEYRDRCARVQCAKKNNRTRLLV